jgi:hypothetical protein
MNSTSQEIGKAMKNLKPALGLGRSTVLCGVMLTSCCSNLQARDWPKDGAPANPATQRIHEEALRIVKSAKSTEYRHKTDIDEKKGAYYCDCSGFVDYVLSRTVAKDDKKGPLGDGKSRPLAMDYEKRFAASKTDRSGRWQKIERVSDARPGDIIAWRHEVPKKGNTGHVVIVDQKPDVEKDGLVRVAEIDSTTLPSSDITGEKGKSGVGRRTMWFKVDKDGRPTGYVRGTRSAKPKMESIAIGRALPATKSRMELRKAG